MRRIPGLVWPVARSCGVEMPTRHCSRLGLLSLADAAVADTKSCAAAQVSRFYSSKILARAERTRDFCLDFPRLRAPCPWRCISFALCIESLAARRSTRPDPKLPLYILIHCPVTQALRYPPPLRLPSKAPLPSPHLRRQDNFTRRLYHSTASLPALHSCFHLPLPFPILHLTCQRAIHPQNLHLGTALRRATLTSPLAAPLPTLRPVLWG